MTGRHTFKGLEEFIALGQTLNFRKAADYLGVTPAAVGSTIRKLEIKVGLRLFHRTTRRVEFSPAGRLLFERCRPALSQVEGALDELGALQNSLSGVLKICTHTMALDAIVHPALLRFAEAHPQIQVELDVREGVVDLVKEGYDIGIRFGEYVEQDMIGVTLREVVPWVLAGNLKYFASYGRPQSVAELRTHRGIRRKLIHTDTHYRWEFIVDGEIVRVDPESTFTVSELSSIAALVASGEGLGYLPKGMVDRLADLHPIETVLAEFMPPPDRFIAYFSPGSLDIRRIKAFLDVVRGNPIGN